MTDHAAPPLVSQDERTLAMLAHALQLPGMWIAPLVIFFVKRESLFVRFHALQALLLQATKLISMFGMMALFFIFMFSFIAIEPHSKFGPPPLVFLFFPVLWLGMFGFVILEIVLSIMF